MRNPQKDLEAIELLKSKQWFKSNKGNMDLAEMCEYYIRKCDVLVETIAEYKLEVEELEEALENSAFTF